MMQSDDHAMNSDGIGDTQESTQGATQPESTPGESQVDAHLWGFLMPCNAAQKRIDFFRQAPKVMIGRHGTNHVVFPGMKVSGNHCAIVWDGVDARTSVVTVHDQSSNGTWINGQKIGKGQCRILREGNEIAFGTPVQQAAEEDYRYIYRHTANGGEIKGVWASYDMGTELGKGSFASVMKAVCRQTGIWYAVKVIHLHKLQQQPANGDHHDGGRRQAQQLENLRREVRILEQLQHPHICGLKEVFFEEASINLVLELVDGGDLLEYILTRGGLREPEAQHITYQLCDALAYVHGRGIAHRDLKPENILLTKEDPPVVKVADFGLAKAIDEHTFLRTMCGTPSYLAPEVVLQRDFEGYDKVVDSWSVGVIVFSMLTNSSPFIEDEDQPDMRVRIAERWVDWGIFEHVRVSPECLDFLQKLLEPEPRQRMTLTTALQHPWLAFQAARASRAPPRPLNGRPSEDSSMRSSPPPSPRPDTAAMAHLQLHSGHGVPASPESVSTTGRMVATIPGAYPRAGHALQRRSQVIAQRLEDGRELPEAPQEMVARSNGTARKRKSPETGTSPARGQAEPNGNGAARRRAAAVAEHEAGPSSSPAKPRSRAGRTAAGAGAGTGNAVAGPSNGRPQRAAAAAAARNAYGLREEAIDEDDEEEDGGGGGARPRRSNRRSPVKARRA